MSKLRFNSKPYIIKNKKYSTIEFVLIFPCTYEKNDMFNSRLLRQILLNSSENYKTEETYKKAYQKNMIISQSLFIDRYNDNLYLEFHLLVPDPKKVKDYDLESAFEFFINTIYKPNAKNNKFDEYCFKREKEYLKNDILNSLKDKKVRAYQSFLNIVDDKGILKDNIYNNMDLIDKSNPTSLYKYYQKNILNNQPIIIIYGNVDEKLNNLIDKYVNTNNKEITVETNYNCFLKPFDNVKNIEEDLEYNQSLLYVAYKVKNMKIKDKLYLNIIKNILVYGSNRLLFKELRLNKKLIYSCNVRNSSVGMIIIEASISSSAKEQTVDGIKNVLDSLKNKEKLQECIDILIEDVKYELMRKKDSRIKPLDDFISKKFKLNLTSEQLLKKYQQIKIDEIMEFLNRLKFDTIYFFRGEMDE